MAKLEDYALIGDCHTAALVRRDSSIDWLCLPRFDSGACFAALLGKPEQGRWMFAPVEEPCRITRRYRDETLILETDFETSTGSVTVVDCMPPRTHQPDLIRMVIGRTGQVAMRMQMIVRFDYGSIIPWVRQTSDGLLAIAGPDSLLLRTPVRTHGEGLTTVAEFNVTAGEQVPFVLTWFASHENPPQELDAARSIAHTEQWWHHWSRRCVRRTPWNDAVQRSLMVLKALTYAPTGGIVAAPTTSLPEQIGGTRNWDYRYCWLRDATLTLYSLLTCGYHAEARAWRDWLLRAVAGSPENLQILYSVTGERRLIEVELPWLSGYEDSRPVRIGNLASKQYQLDVFGEVFDVLYQCRRLGMQAEEAVWHMQRAIMKFLEQGWREPDEGIWEVRGPRRHFTHSKMMAWVALDRAIKSIEQFGLEGPLEAWRKLRQTIHDEVCQRGFSRKRNAFVQSFDSELLDASLLMMAPVGFLPIEDPRVRGTVEAIEKHLVQDGFVARYHTESDVDGLPPGEGVFLPCSFWLADNYALLGRHEEARELFERLLSLRNDVGLIAEEYDPKAGRLVGNFPQAFTHVALVNTAHNLSPGGGPSEERQG